ncbi:thioredoxin reductase 1, cytoplasmic-like [Leucoraja erinacea]|uniref:thioredoxin reductase 1, cytoplasmic-like n=1 Tax=Leucoraja erinaceus TaxID=7782 RepID=UPI0024582BAD|nr:thioredoxin reductase 1, cytoplasmic-like [Leucoraja erinacea]
MGLTIGSSRGGDRKEEKEAAARMASTTLSAPQEEMKATIKKLIDSNMVVVFSKSTCPYCKKVKDLFASLGVDIHVVELDVVEKGALMQEMLNDITGQKTVPNVFVNKAHLGGFDSTKQAQDDGLLKRLLDGGEMYDYDLIVIGGGSGGLAASKEAANLNKKVLVFDFVVPTPRGTTWGLGGTCVNVGCIPKKLMHQAAILNQNLSDSRKFGWEFEEAVQHNWIKMKDAIQKYIGSLNWGYRVALRDKKVTYHNSFVEFVEPHKVKATNRKGTASFHTADKFIIATGERPRYLNIPGDKEYCITSDDLFSLPYCPGNTLVIGASYVALECAGFLAGLGLQATVMVRSIFLRGFDQEMAGKVGTFMESHGVKFLKKYVPTKIEELEAGTPGRIKVTAKSTSSREVITGEYNTVIIAVGREACTKHIGLEKVGVTLNDKNGKILVDSEERTNVPYIYGIGDVIDGKLELTPVAVQAGKLLARRLYKGASLKCDYVNVCTTVFTPLEYGCCGLSEENAKTLYGDAHIEVYHSFFLPLEWTITGKDKNTCYGKVICSKLENNKVVGFHILGPNAGEITQGFGAAMKCGMTKEQLSSVIGIHPTCAEVFTTMDITKRSGVDVSKKGGC